MHTILLALIHSKYNGRFEGAFVGTVILDIVLMAGLYALFTQFYHG